MKFIIGTALVLLGAGCIAVTPELNDGAPGHGTDSNGAAAEVESWTPGGGVGSRKPESNGESAREAENAGDEVPGGREVKFETIERGSNSGYTEAKCAAVSDKEAFKALWRRLYSPRSSIPDPPELRFDRGLVLGVFMGQQPTGGYAVTISSVRRTTDELIVEIDRRVPGPDEIVTQALTSPYHLVWVELEDTGMPVRFLNCPAEQ